MSAPTHRPAVDNTDNWSAGKLVILGIITLAVAFTVINFIAESGIDKY